MRGTANDPKFIVAQADNGNLAPLKEVMADCNRQVTEDAPIKMLAEHLMGRVR